jgi:2-polyprenyl-3-methyl-5-hydroxy-6-metoxy-1,4-benzoquinol methylase
MRVDHSDAFLNELKVPHTYGIHVTEPAAVVWRHKGLPFDLQEVFSPGGQRDDLGLSVLSPRQQGAELSYGVGAFEQNRGSQKLMLLLGERLTRPPSRFCPVCEQPQLETLQNGIAHYPTIDVVRCVCCGITFLWPLPDDEQLARYYHGEYRQETGDLPSSERYEPEGVEASTRVNRIRDLLTPTSHVLEVGPGSGAFLNAVRPLVSTVQSVEADPAARAWIDQKLGLKPCLTLDDCDGDFDVVVMFHVLEHLPDPVGLLRSLRGRLRADGVIVIEVPNVEDALLSVYQIPCFKAFYFQRPHLYYFSAATLKRTLAQARFKSVVEGIQRYDLSNHFRWALTGAGGGQGYYADLFPEKLNQSYAKALIRAGRSDALWCVARPRT